MTILNVAVKEANDRGALALMIYAIPNFPDPDTYQDILAILHENPCVTIIETTFPVTSRFSEFANQTIQNAHLQAAQFKDGLSVMETLQPFKKPTVCVLYRETYEKLGYEAILQKIQGKIDGLLFEWVIPDVEAYAYSFERYSIELVQCAEPSMTDQEMARYLSLAVEEPIVYLVSAPMTGAEIFSEKKIISCVQSIKTYRPNAKIVAGFGISNADDIAKLSRIEGLDGVIIGTAFLQVMQQGSTQTAAFLNKIAPSLSRA
ncbi:tryptophan synthase subunit alpha [Desulfobulbus sp. TB]|nr:tryptophan synthase subunit alpha [Desulfobulbus sp. TB]